MIRCHFSTLIGKHRIKITDVEKATGISRSILYLLYHERIKRVNIDVMDKLCEFFGCAIGELFEYQKELN